MMKRILKYANTYRKAMSIALFLMIVELIVELVQPIIMAKMIDDGIQVGNMQVIYVYGGVLLGITIVAFAAGITSSFFAAEVSQGVGHDLRNDMFGHIQMFSAMKMQQFATSTLLTRMTNDVTQVQNLLFAFMRIMLRAPLFLVFGIVMSFTLNVSLALILLAAVPILMIVMFFLLIKGMTLFRYVQQQIDRVNTVIRENLLGIKLVKAFHHMTFENKRFAAINAKLKDQNSKALWIMEMVMPIVMLIMNVAMIALLGFGYLQLETDSAQAGEVVGVINYATRMLASLGVFSFLLMNLSRGRASANRIDEVLSAQCDDQVDAAQERTYLHGDVAFVDVSFQYPNSKRNVLDQLHFTVKAGERVGILGETGSGKTTLLNLIPYLYHPSNGTIWIDGVPIEQLGNRVRHDITLVPQEGFLFSGTILDNITWGNDHLSLDEAKKVAIEAQLHDFVLSLPNQYDTVIGQRGVNLSGGQKQRLSIARALADNPKVLLLDDSTSALDATTETKVLEAIRQRKCTTFLVSQKISSVKDADQILVLDKGKIVGMGTHQQLINTNQLYQSIADSQLKKGVKIDDE
ncbi:ABC transporter ATP-binding protein/permease [Gracilibacillus caseinilyticus]|uniref:ABC transporter ATP-binding protein/permease n=1 Tax=Gracilibacillus caseinilyticus TaxID=2932256 RepID=A0ABY4F6I8_9BACI|nr:ABC transporter ATP-binding protein [Gracilibacillus caseinilyticus]UOQ50066.1 ABC transporter ATP-binding protein/permease [Gracilibacillus caseinilyticus]